MSESAIWIAATPSAERDFGAILIIIIATLVAGYSLFHAVRALRLGRTELVFWRRFETIEREGHPFFFWTEVGAALLLGMLMAAMVILPHLNL